MPADDVAFTFDPTPILNGVKRIDEGMNNLSRGFQKSSAKMSRSIATGVVKATAAVGAIVGAFKGLGNVMKRMPEIGQVFKIAGDIFFKNFLFPIRKELMPLLQGLLDWVRDNRAVFVRWGMAVAGAIRFVVKVVKGLIGLLQTIGKRLLEWMGMDSLDEFISILQFKIAVIIIGVKMLATSVAGFLRGLWDRVGDDVSNLGGNLLETLKTIASDVLGWIMDFGTGFADTFKVTDVIETVIDVWNRLVETFQALWAAIFGEGRGDKWGKFFKGLGSLAGAGLMLYVDAMAALYRVILNVIKDIINTNAFRKLMDFYATLASLMGGVFELGAEGMQWLSGILQGVGRREDENKTPGEENLTGTNTSIAGATPRPDVTNNKNFQITINVDGAGSPELVGAAVVDTIQQRINTEGQIEGAY